MRFKTYNINSTVCEKWNHQDRRNNNYYCCKNQDNCVQFNRFERTRSDRFNFPNMSNKFGDHEAYPKGNRAQAYWKKGGWEIV